MIRRGEQRIIIIAIALLAESILESVVALLVGVTSASVEDFNFIIHRVV
jgi:hypothetical protein